MSAAALVVTRPVAQLTVTPDGGVGIVVQAPRSAAALTASGGQGPAGRDGQAGSATHTVEVEIEASGGAQAVTIPTPFSVVQSLFRNGLRERSSSFSTAGNVVTLPSFTEPGDIIAILYYPN